MTVKYQIMDHGALVYIKAIGPLGSAEITLTRNQYGRFERWASGVDSRMIQEVFPDLSASQREILMTGIGPDQWDKMFKGEED